MSFSAWQVLRAADLIDMSEVFIETPATVGGGDGTVVFASNPYTPTRKMLAKVDLSYMLAISAPGRSGNILLQRSIGGGAWVSMRSFRWHDNSDGENIDSFASMADGSDNWTLGSTVEFRGTLNVDSGLGSVTLRADSSRATIQWFGRTI